MKIYGFPLSDILDSAADIETVYRLDSQEVIVEELGGA
jgi:hypothetical protein